MQSSHATSTYHIAAQPRPTTDMRELTFHFFGYSDVYSYLSIHLDDDLKKLFISQEHLHLWSTQNHRFQLFLATDLFSRHLTQTAQFASRNLTFHIAFFSFSPLFLCWCVRPTSIQWTFATETLCILSLSHFKDIFLLRFISMW